MSRESGLKNAKRKVMEVHFRGEGAPVFESYLDFYAAQVARNAQLEAIEAIANLDTNKRHPEGSLASEYPQEPMKLSWK